MSPFQAMPPERLDHLRLGAYSIFGPMLLKDALQRLCQRDGAAAVEKYVSSMVDRIDQMKTDVTDLHLMKELAIEQLMQISNEVRAAPDAKQECEDVNSRLTPDRSVKEETLEEQLQAGLEDTFPASDPPAVVSTAITGGGKDLVGTEESLRERKAEPA